ncbi:hypothetical protein IWX91DRAFT_118635 [Phyllosticta citricarpa]
MGRRMGGTGTGFFFFFFFSSSTVDMDTTSTTSTRNNQQLNNNSTNQSTTNVATLAKNPELDLPGRICVYLLSVLKMWWGKQGASEHGGSSWLDTAIF